MKSRGAGWHATYLQVDNWNLTDCNKILDGGTANFLHASTCYYVFCANSSWALDPDFMAGGQLAMSTASRGDRHKCGRHAPAVAWWVLPPPPDDPLHSKSRRGYLASQSSLMVHLSRHVCIWEFFDLYFKASPRLSCDIQRHGSC